MQKWILSLMLLSAAASADTLHYPGLEGQPGFTITAAGSWKRGNGINHLIHPKDKPDSHPVSISATVLKDSQASTMVKRMLANPNGQKFERVDLAGMPAILERGDGWFRVSAGSGQSRVTINYKDGHYIDDRIPSEPYLKEILSSFRWDK